MIASVRRTRILPDFIAASPFVAFLYGATRGSPVRITIGVYTSLPNVHSNAARANSHSRSPIEKR